MNNHLSEESIFALAMTGRSDPHVLECAFCREQLRLASALEKEETPPLEKAVDRMGELFGEYKLAAATPEMASPVLRLRHTFYLERRSVILRIFENTSTGRLCGVLIIDPALLPVVRVRFTDIDGEFVPGEDGSFDICPASFDIESSEAEII
jgi:hypothetical protein